MGASKVVIGGDVKMDLTQDTVTADKLAEGVTAHGADGEPIIGTALGGITEAEADARYLPLTGGTLSGSIILPNDERVMWGGGAYISGGADKIQLGTGKVALGGARLTELADPNADEDAATKQYVDTEVSSRAPAYTYGTADLTAGDSPLETGTLYFVYE